VKLFEKIVLYESAKPLPTYARFLTIY